MIDYRALAAAALSGQTCHQPVIPGPGAFGPWVANEGLAALLVRADPSWARSGPLHQTLAEASCRQLAMGALQERELRTLIAACRDAGIVPVFLKGAALGYMVYEDPALRARRDTDFIVPPTAVDPLRQILERLGYQRVAQAPGQLATSQFHYGRYD